MSCEAEKLAFEDAIQSAAAKLRAEIAAVSESVEQKSREASEKADDGNDLAQGVGAAAGSAIGGLVAGPGGAVVGAAIGRVIGSQFKIEVSQIRYNVSLDVPQVNVANTEFVFDTPEIEMHPSDIVYNLPTLVMKTIRGPDQIVVITGSERKCTSVRIPVPFGDDIVSESCIDVPTVRTESRPTYYDQPTWEDRENRISIAVPEVRMVAQKLVVGVPQIAMAPTSIEFDVPSITIRYVQDVGKATAALMESVQAEATANISQKQLSFRERMRSSVVPLAISMFDCYKQQLKDSLTKTSAMFDPQIEQLANSLRSLVASGIPQDDDDYVKLKGNMDALIEKRAKAMQGIADAIAKLSASADEAVSKLSGTT